MANLSERLQQLKRDKNLLKMDIALGAGISLRSYQYYEQGKSKPTSDVIIALAKFFNVSSDYLLGIVDEEQPYNNQLDEREKRILNSFNKLNDFGKEEANKRVRELTEVPKYVQSQTVKVACRGAGIQEIDIEIIKKLIQDAEKNKDKNIDDLF